MTTPRPRRRHARLLAVTAVVAGVAALIPSAATALPQEGFTLPPRSTVEREYPPIPANDPATVTVDHTIMDPATCAQTPSCAVVPIDIEVPELDPGDDFYVAMTVGFDAEDIGGATNSNDLDVFLYDDGQKAEEEGSSGYTEIASSASGDNPEFLKAFEPMLGRYNLVVINFAGGNTGWTLKAESLVGEFEKPIESLTPSGGTANRNKPTTTTTTTTTRPSATTTTVTVTEGLVIPDDDFEGGAFAPEANDFQAQLDSAAADFEELQELRASSGDSPSALTVAAWMILLPAALAAAAFVAMRARRSRRRSAGAATA